MSEQKTAEKYGTLHMLAGLLTFVGSAIALAGALSIVIGVVIAGENRATLFAIAGVAALPMGVLLLASGESMNVQLDTEHNTRQAALATAMMLADLHELKDLVGHIDASTRRTATAVEALAATVRR